MTDPSGARRVSGGDRGATCRRPRPRPRPAPLPTSERPPRPPPRPPYPHPVPSNPPGRRIRAPHRALLHPRTSRTAPPARRGRDAGIRNARTLTLALTHTHSHTHTNTRSLAFEISALFRRPCPRASGPVCSRREVHRFVHFASRGKSATIFRVQRVPSAGLGGLSRVHARPAPIRIDFHRLFRPPSLATCALPSTPCIARMCNIIIVRVNK